MVRYSLGSNYTPNYNQVSRIRQFCNNNPGTPGCSVTPKDIYTFSMKDYSVYLPLISPNVTYTDFSFNEYDASYNIYDSSNNTLTLEFFLNENNLDVTGVTLTSSLLKNLFTWSYNRLTSILTINLSDYLGQPITYCNVYVTGTRPLTENKTLTVNLSGTFSNIIKK